ncbi:MAG: SLBB domain-containing protein [Candidatus Eisenbacteria sp.]|nr:SLBB domain-containing protein [Candidatus Eisenbacteria bacterium]
MFTQLQTIGGGARIRLLSLLLVFCLSLVSCPLLAAGSVAAQESAPPQAPAAAFSGSAAQPEAVTAQGAGWSTEPGSGLEAAIAGDSYRLGPGDSLMVGIWAPQPVTFDLGVNVEGKLILPGIGEYAIDGMLLDEAREMIIAALMQHFHDVEITVALTQLRRFQVHVLGQVVRPGTYLGTAVDRISAAVHWAGGFAPNASERRIQVTSADSLRAQADLFIFLRRGIPGANPWLRDGDIIYVPFARHRFTVRGAVNEPGDFEYLKGDRLGDAISFAGGFTPEAFPDTLEIVRYIGPDRHPVRFFAIAAGALVAARPRDEAFLPDVTGRFMVHDVPMRSGGTVEYPDFDLLPDDMVFVRAIPEYRVKRLVEIGGEVVYPGFYAISEGESRLADTIERAGGVTREAFLREAELIRREAIRLEEGDREFERLKKIPSADMTEDEYEYFKLRSRENPGRMVVDFERLLIDGDETQDLLLRHGDLITIPTRRDFISVLGMVGAPGNIIYRADWSPKDYIVEAGGFSEKADRGATRVIRASSGEWVSLSDADDLEPGDTIWVPERRDRDYWQFFKDVLTVTTQIVTIYLVVDRAIEKK